MKWEKKGLIYQPPGDVPWMKKYGMMPTPVHLPAKKIIRIFIGVTTDDNFGRTTYVDVDENNPSVIRDVEKKHPILDLGLPGMFDDSGAVPSCFVASEDKYFLYYVGFQRTQQVPYMLFPGLATSIDGKVFTRFSNAPVIDRANGSAVSLAAPFVLRHDQQFKMWLWIGQDWTVIQNKKYIRATIGYAESVNGSEWVLKKTNCIVPQEPHEFSVGRPWVVFDGVSYRMFYSVRYVEKLYRLGYAESVDGLNWTRKDQDAGIDVSDTGWDSQMICYPAVITVKGRTYLFYNGNNNGETGFGWAELKL
jgi:hypothetical protein